jgi:hypothetical protein
MGLEDKQFDSRSRGELSGHRTAGVIALDVPVPGELVEEISQKLSYASDQVRSARLSADRARVEVVLDNPAHLEPVSRQIRSLIGALIRGYRDVDKPIIWRNAVEPAHRAPIWDDLQARGLLASSGPGCVALLGDAHRLFEALDRMFATTAYEQFGAVGHRYSSLIASATLERCDYFSSFPHHITFAGHLRESVDLINQVANADSAARSQAVADTLSPPTHLLTPAVCFHTYAWLADRAVTSPVTVSAGNRRTSRPANDCGTSRCARSCSSASRPGSRRDANRR